MVLRKEENPDTNAGLVPAPLSKANPPYPTSPLDEHPPAVPSSSAHAPLYSPNLNKSPAFNFKTLDEAKKEQYNKQDVDFDSSEDEWGRSDDEDFEEVTAKDVPDALKPGGGKAPATSHALPDALRPGPPAGIPVKRSIDNISPMPTGASATSYGAKSTVSEQSSSSIPFQTNNPFLKAQQTGQSHWAGETSQQIWGDTPSYAHKYDDPVELPASQTPIAPTHDLASLNVNRSKSLDQPPLIAVDAATPLNSPQSNQHMRNRIDSNPWEPGMDVSTLDVASRAHGLPEDSHHAKVPRTWQEQQDWERSERQRRQQEASVAHEAAVRAEQERKHEEDYHRLEQAAPSTNPFFPAPPDGLPPPPPVASTGEQLPKLPPRALREDVGPPMPPQSIDTNLGSVTTTGPESPNTTMNRQRKEHYQIKHIRWHDVNKPGIRTSPILTQNLNGPCPLLALVNALILSTPSGIETALVETLRTREQVSLGLLLDAVFDELMSGRRGTAAQELPDVSDLYKFLLALHTGLNVNPMFVPDTDTTNGNTALTNRPVGRAGGFENTKDMKLYRTFNIPLLHGWLPEASSEAYAAFNRVAKSYETSQYVQFQEEELDAKLQSSEALTTDEQQMFTDIHAIKEFLSTWPTQLTGHGLKVMRDSIEPGQVAILFRNDHFSTLFKDPRTNKLLTLVTDQGYSGHDEIVWESLVDVNGQGSELFSGDFRPVGNSLPPQQHQQVQSMLDIGGNQGWAAAQSRGGDQHHASAQNTAQAPGGSAPHELSRAEQEDHDLALALQLQEEEEDRERREIAQRQRDSQASGTALSAQSQAHLPNRHPSRNDQPPVIPPRRNNITTHQPNVEPAPPPTYEEAATRPQYHPPQGHPASSHAPFPQQGSAYQANGGNLPPRRPTGRPMPGHPGRQSTGPIGHGQPQPENREKCIVM